MATSGGGTPAGSSPAGQVAIGGSITGVDGGSNSSVVGPVAASGTAMTALSIANYIFNGASWDRYRTPVKLKTVTATALGATALWTPAAGKKFRLMRLIVTVTANASLAVAGLEEVTLLDSATDIGFGASWFVPGAAGAVFGEQTTGWIDLGNGVLSAVANNVLNVNLGTALATGECRVFCVGTEE